jgi:hypothetical protein
MSPEELERRRAAANPPKDPGAELLIDGQEEVFSRTEVERGAIEHHTLAGGHSSPGPEQARRDEEQTRRQAPENASPGEAAGSPAGR